jgi:Zn-dependent M28 family amino/carboxypeptidase
VKRALIRFLVTLMLFAGITTRPAHAQQLAFLSDDEIRMISNEISGDRSYEHIRRLSPWHRDSGMEGYFKAADYVMEAAKEIGLEDVHFVEQPLGRPNYTARSAELWMVEPVEVKLADLGDRAVHLADGSHDADLTAELVWIGDAQPESFKDVDVKGKIVLTDGSPGLAAVNAVWARGAAGVVTYETSEDRNPLDVGDQIAWSRIPLQGPEGKPGTFAFVLSPRTGEMLREVLATKGPQDVFATGKRTPGGRVVLRAKVDTDIGQPPGRTGFVEGIIRGSKYHDQQIILTAHLQEEQGSANDDGSGCGNLLEMARTIIKLVREGKMKQPLRDIRFWWTDEIYSEYEYFKSNPDEPKKYLANIHEDMVGANQAMGSRVQHLIFAPFSRTSYLDTVFESVGNFLILTNNGFLAASRAGGLPRPFTRPIYSVRGTRQGYNARFVPYFDSSDHMCFVEGAIGVPAVATINWDDNYIHSSEDDLFQIDQTQLRRNAFLILATTLVLASAEEDRIPLLARETFAHGTRRLANDLTVAMRLVGEKAVDPDTAWKNGSAMIEQGALREARALGSIRVFARGGAGAASGGAVVDAMIARVKSREAELLADLRAEFKAARGRDPKPIALTPAEAAASKRIPANVAPLRAYFDNRQNTDYDGSLHSLMRDETFNFVDGKRSYYDIYKAVYAESMAGGTWYYGTVTLEEVVKLLDAAVAAKALTVR